MTHPNPTRPRVALYSHDTYGLGHLRRSLVLARALERCCPRVETLLITGSPRALSFPLPPSVRIVRLPAVTKDRTGAYVARTPELSLEETLRQRKRVIRDSVVAFRPDVFVVDHSPMGLRGELLPLLGDLRHRTQTELILGLRDILDDPSRVVQDWSQTGVYRLLESIYHRVWVYGVRDVFALDELYSVPEAVAKRMRYLGYLGREIGGAVPSMSLGFKDPDRPHLLCLIGGGGDGFPLAHAFLRMLALSPHRFNGTLVTGPFLSRNKRNRLLTRAASLPHAQILRFTTNLQHLARGSDAILTMGGYNAMMELVSLNQKTLVVPRVFPRREQWLRAHAFERLGLVSVLDPERLHPDTLERATRSLLDGSRPPTPAELGIIWDGALNFATRVENILDQCTSRKKDSVHAREELLRA